MLINDRLGTTTALDPQCDADGLGPPWVLLSCPPYGPDVELYSIAGGTRQTVTPAAGLPPQCTVHTDAETLCVGVPDAVGGDWIRWDASCYHCGNNYLFQNIQTGKLRDDPSNATTFADLNSPALAHTTCPGVRLLSGVAIDTTWGSLTPYGQFAIATGTNRQYFPTVFLERCGTRMRRLLVSGRNFENPDPPLASNPGAIVWQAVRGRLNGLFLPSLQTFTIPLPFAIVKPGLPTAYPVGALRLTSRALYVEDSAGTLWRTASPTALPRNTTRPTLRRSGNTLTCSRGSWRNAVRFSYTWQVNGSPRKGATKPELTVGKAPKPHRVSCSVTASNAAGMTTASSAQLHVR